jgi:hypothetical protein
METIEQEQLKKENQQLRMLVEALILKGESLIQRARAMDMRLLGKKPTVELGEIIRFEVVVNNAKMSGLVGYSGNEK